MNEAADWLFVNTNVFADLGPQRRIELIKHVLSKDPMFIENYKTINPIVFENIRAGFKL